MSFNYKQILSIPDRCLLNKRLTKSFFLKNFQLSVVEKKVLNTNIEQMEWLASIKPSNSNITAEKNTDIAFEEIQVIICTIPIKDFNVNAEKIAILFQKYIPYQLMVIMENDNEFIINTCDKRINQNDSSKRTIEHHYFTSSISKLYKNDITESFFESLNFSGLNKTNLETTYKSYVRAVIQFQTAMITGKFEKRNQLRSEEDMVDLQIIESIENDIISLKSQLKKESQMNGKVELNIEIQNKRNTIETIKNRLIK